MLLYLTSLVSSVVLLGAVVAVLIVNGGWEAAAAGVAVGAASVWLVCLLIMLAAEDRTPRGRGPRPA